MANTKHSAAREIIIDRLLRERRGYSLQEILNKVNESLEWEGFPPVSESCIRKDLNVIQHLYNKKLTIEKHSFRLYYKYKDPESTIFTNVLTRGELQLIQSALNTIRYIDPMEGTMMYKELPDRVGKILGIETEENPVVIYGNPPSFNNLKRFRILYEYILKQYPAIISFKTDKTKAEQSVIVHPYHLLQRDGEWFLLCHDATNDCATEISLSRIKQIDYADGTEFIPNKDFDFKEYYKNIKLTA